MDWIFLTLTCSLIEALAALFGRFSVKNLSKHTDIIVMLWGYFAGFMFILPALLTGKVHFHPVVALISFSCGALYLLAEHYYFRAVNTVEINRIVPILSISPIFILIGATVFFQEIHQLSKYFGMGMILLGIVINSWDQQKRDLINRRAIVLAILAAIFYSIKSLNVKWLGLMNFDPLNIIFWIGAGILLINIFITAKVFHHVRRLDRQALANLSLAAALKASANLLFTAAITIGPAAIVAFLDRLEILFVFIISTFLDLFHPQILREKFVKEAFFQKLAAVIIILIGGYLLI